MTQDQTTNGEEVMELLTQMFQVFDDKNAELIINTLQIAMMMVIYQVNEGNEDGCYDDIDMFYEHMLDHVMTMGALKLPDISVDIASVKNKIH